MLRFSDLNPLGRAIIVVVVMGTFGIAAMAFALSYGALYAWARDQHLYSGWLERSWPLMLDAAFIIAELAAILGGMIRGWRGWPVTVMAITGALTIWFNVQHAGGMDDLGRSLTAALPPVLMMLCFQIVMTIVGWLMRAFGRASAEVPMGALLLGPQAAPPMQAYTEVGQSGHGRRGSGGETKRQTVEAYLARLGPERGAQLTAREISADLAEEGTPVSERYVHDLLGGRSSRNGHGKP